MIAEFLKNLFVTRLGLGVTGARATGSEGLLVNPFPSPFEEVEIGLGTENEKTPESFLSLMMSFKGLPSGVSLPFPLDWA